MLELPFTEDAFDCAMAVQSVYHTDTAGFIKCLGEIKRVLRPGGELFITLISKDSPSFAGADPSRFIDVNTVLRDDSPTEQDVPHFFVSLADIAKLFSGLEFLKQPMEYCEHNIENLSNSGSRWALLLKSKKED